MIGTYKCGHLGYIQTDCVIRGDEDIHTISPEQSTRATHIMATMKCFTCLIAEREAEMPNLRQEILKHQVKAAAEAAEKLASIAKKGKNKK